MKVSRSIDEDTLTAAVPTLILQTLVENAIKHGIAKTPGPGAIEISASRKNSNLQLAVKNEAPGLTYSDRTNGMGLSITRQRLEKLYGNKQEFRLDQLPEGTVLACVTIPFRTHDEE